MSGKRDAAAAALRRVPMLHADFIEPAVLMLEAAGVFESERGGNSGSIHAAVANTAPGSRPGSPVLTMVQAGADPPNQSLLKSVRAQAQRLGFVWDGSKPIDTHALNSAIAGADIDSRMRLKEALYLLRMIPA